LFHLSAIGPSIKPCAAAAFTYFANHWLEETSENPASAAHEVLIHAASTRVFTNSALFMLSAGLKLAFEESKTQASARASTYGANQASDATSL
jgi:hypothetical protein